MEANKKASELKWETVMDRRVRFSHIKMNGEESKARLKELKTTKK